MKAIPTVYKGAQMRSRLEARWAAFFDILGWDWEYEPFDCDGWIPDFAIKGCQTTLVEVKPIGAFCDETAAKILKACPKRENGIVKFELLLVGFTPLIRKLSSSWGDNSLGWLHEDDEMGWNMGWADALLGQWSADEKTPATFGFCHSVGNHTDRISGVNIGNGDGDIKTLAPTIEQLWNEAGSKVQWKPAKKARRKVQTHADMWYVALGHKSPGGANHRDIVSRLSLDSSVSICPMCHLRTVLNNGTGQRGEALYTCMNGHDRCLWEGARDADSGQIVTDEQAVRFWERLGRK